MELFLFCHTAAIYSSFSIIRAKPGGFFVGEHRVEITKSGLELHSRERGCDAGKWPRGNTCRNQCLKTVFVFCELMK